MPPNLSRRRPTVWTTVVFALALLMLGLSLIAVAFWTPIDETFVNRADAAGNMSLLLPHQTGLWLVLHAQVFATFLISVFAFLSMWKSRTERSNTQSGPQPSDQLHTPSAT